MEAVEFLNGADRMPYESISGGDRPHRIVGSGQWELPYGRTKRWGNNAPGVMQFILGDWKLNGMYQRQSGSPLGFGQALFVGDSSNIALSSPERGADRWFNTDVFQRQQSHQLANNLRTSPLRYSNIRTDSQRRLDLSMIKYFKVTERVTMQFRAETFNALNEVVLRAPNTDPYNTAFGRATAQEPPRSWQFALQLQW
jgi:hypothetical protein